jgi:hypothetical protein
MERYNLTNDSQNGSDGKTTGKRCAMLFNTIKEKYPDVEFRYIFNNIVKIVPTAEKKQQKVTEQEYQLVEQKYFNVIREEVTIIQPDVIIFFTGNTEYYENKIKNIFGNVVYKEVPNIPLRHVGGKIGWERIMPVEEPLNYFPIKALARVELSDFPFCKDAFRTYHPCHRWRRGELYEKYYAIRDEIEL